MLQCRTLPVEYALTSILRRRLLLLIKGRQTDVSVTTLIIVKRLYIGRIPYLVITDGRNVTKNMEN